MIEVAVVCFGIFAIGLAASELKQIKKSTSADLMLRFDEIIARGDNLSIIDAVEHNQPILSVFSELQLDTFLGSLELLNSVYEAELVSSEMLCTSFSDYIVRSYRNPEIRAYLAEVQKSDPAYFRGFQLMAQQMLDQELCYESPDEL